MVFPANMATSSRQPLDPPIAAISEQAGLLGVIVARRDVRNSRMSLVDTTPESYGPRRGRRVVTIQAGAADAVDAVGQGGCNGTEAATGLAGMADQPGRMLEQFTH